MLKTAEAVTPKHPDKICDRISDAIVDACLAFDPKSRAAVEVMGGHNLISVTGEITTTGWIDIPSIVTRIVGKGYGVQVNIVGQSPEIASGVDIGGAGDQGIMVGYACADNLALVPQEIYLAKNLCQYLYAKHPVDGKTQITLDDSGKITAVVASFCGIKKVELENLIKEWLAARGLAQPENIYANPAGDWEVGGFDSDTGVTGRKLACDNYGPQIPIGGGCFSGKDPSKVDRSGAYMARKIAVDYLKKYHAKEVLVKLAYAIGMAEPVMATAVVDGIEREVTGYDLTPAGIIKFLELARPQYEQVAEWGSFGNGFLWDK